MFAPPRLCLLATVAALALTSCNAGGGDVPGGGGATAPRCAGRPARGHSVKLSYRVESAPGLPGSFAETISALCARVRRLGLREVSIAAVGANLVMAVPRGLKADARAAAMPGAVGVFDWDSNAMGAAGTDRPFSGSTALFDAVRAASQARPRPEAGDRTPGGPADLAQADRANDTAPVARYYLFGSDRRPLAGPAWSRGALATARGRTRPGARVLKVPAGILVIEAQRAKGQPESVKRYFVLEDDVEVSRTDITEARAGTDGATREPVVRFGFTHRGRAAIGALTERVAQRAARRVAAGGGSSSGKPLGRVAVVLDDRVASLVAIDPRESPQGLDARAGARVAGVGTRAQARRLALLLGDKPLPAHLAPLGVSR